MALHSEEITQKRGCENKVPWRIFLSKREDVTAVQRKLHNEELHNVYDSRNVIREIKSKRI